MGTKTGDEVEKSNQIKQSLGEATVIHEFYPVSKEKCLESFKLEDNTTQVLFRLHFLLCRE